MRILLVDAFDLQRIVSLPASLGLGQIEAHMLSLGHNILTINGMRYGKALIDKVVEFKPEIVGISCVTDSRKYSFGVAKRIKEKFHDIPIVFGGVHPILFYEKLIKRDYIDGIVDGEGEKAFEVIVETYKKDGSLKSIDSNLPIVTKNNFTTYNRMKVKPLLLEESKIGFVRHHRISKCQQSGKRAGKILTSWGCPFKCIFCASGSHLRTQYRKKTLDVLMEELEYLASMDAKMVHVVDDLFFIDLDRAKELLRKIRKRKFAFQFIVKSRVDMVDYELFQLFDDIGVRLCSVGVESGSERLLKIMRKGIARDEIIAAFEMAARRKFQMAANLIVGIPGETEEDYRLTNELIREIRADSLAVSLNRVYPNTQVYRMCLEEGYMCEEYFDDDDNVSPFYSFERDINELKETAIKMYMKWFINTPFSNKIKNLQAIILTHGFRKIMSLMRDWLIRLTIVSKS